MGKEDWGNKSSNQIITEVKEMEAEHEVIKLQMLALYDKLEALEKKHAEANTILIKRIKGEIE